MNFKKALCILLAMTMVFGLCACGKKEEPHPDTRIFTDSLGREVEVPFDIEKIAVSGPLAQISCFALCPDKLVGIANAWNPEAENILDTKYYQLPELGQLYGGKGELNLETLLNSGAQVVIDVGEPKKTAKEDLDALQEQTDIPFVHITMHTDSMEQSYRKLGELVGMPEEAEQLAVYCEKIYNRTYEIAEKVEKVDLIYVVGKGQNVIAKDSYQSEVIDLLSNNLAVVDSPSSKGTGNEVDMEQILKWNPEYILCGEHSTYEAVLSDSTWKTVDGAVKGNVYEVPIGPYNWMGFPPSVQRLLGMMWMAKLLYPEACDYDLYEEVKEYFSLFYHCELNKELYDSLVANSIGK